MNFAALPDSARLWIFAASRPLSEQEKQRLLGPVDEFVDNWLAHRHPVVGARDLRYNQFLLIAADERATGVSGCSIDGLFHVLQKMEADLGIRLTDRAGVWFRNAAGEIEAVSRAEFRTRVNAGEVGPDTIVFDNSVTTIGDVRAGRWETPMRESWHAGAFPLPAGSAA